MEKSLLDSNFKKLLVISWVAGMGSTGINRQGVVFCPEEENNDLLTCYDRYNDSQYRFICRIG